MKQCLLIFSVLSASILAKDEEPQLVPSTPDQIAILTADAESLIGGYVSPLSGQVSVREIDLVVKGAQDIVLSRVYVPLAISPPSNIPPPENGDQEDRYGWYESHRNFWVSFYKNYQGWVYLPHLFIETDLSGYKLYVRDKSGSTYEFRNTGNNYILTSAIYGMSNLCGESPSGTYDPRNIRIEAQGQWLHVFCQDGSTRIYKRAPFACRLQKEILPNGKILRYTFQTPDNVLIESMDPKERYVYNSLRIEGVSALGSCAFSSHRGDAGSYSYVRQTKALGFKQKKKHGKFNPKLPREENFETGLPPVLTFVSAPSYRSTSVGYTPYLQLNSFSGKDVVFQCSYDSSFQRIEALALPVGLNDTFVNVYEMSYDPPIAGHKSGTTTVKQIDGLEMVYHFSSEFLTTMIQTFSPDGKLTKEKIFTWRGDHRLESIELKNGDGTLFCKKSYAECDSWGNPGLETLTGDLSGNGVLETRITKREYSKDGRNLLLREETEEGKIIVFEYLKGTILPVSKLTFDHERLAVREFWDYDDSNNLIEKIIDDGSSKDKAVYSDTTQRTITRYRLCQEKQFFHMPEWIEEFYWDGSVEQLLKKTKLVYDQRGYIAEEQSYGSDGKHAWTLYYEHDEQGNLLSESNPLDYQATYEYTPRGQCKYSKNFSGCLEKKMGYDAQGCLKTVEEIGGCATHLTEYGYDYFGRCTEKTNYLGNKTTYKIDPVAGKVYQTNGPSIASINGKAEVITTSRYDSLGLELQTTDANGLVTTTTSRNAYGSPVEIVHPNGSKETYRYYKNGQLKSHIGPDGLTIEWIYDIFNRILEKKYSAQGNLFARETFTYSSFQLLTYTDKEQNRTVYSYDRGGRKISEVVLNRISTYQYDPLGRLSSITKNKIVRYFDRDKLDRIEEEWQADLEGRVLAKIRYGFDGDGNKSSITRFPHNEEATQVFVYDPFGRLVEEKDALGNATVTKYDETQLNSLGQRILTSVSIDPKGMETRITYDPYKRETSRQIGSSYSEKKAYDPAGNLLQIQEDSLLTRYAYNSQNLVESLTRAHGTKEARTTLYTYTPGGQLETKTKSDLVVLTYTYDPLGKLKTISSSDGTINQNFVYNLNGFLTFASDKFHTIERMVDCFGNIEQETIDQRLVLSKTYDELDRPLTIALPDRSWIEYSYNPLNLKTVERYSADGSRLYTHIYDSYDWARLLYSEKLVGNLGIVKHTYNLNGMQKTIQSPYFEQTLKYDSKSLVVAISGEGIYDYDELSQLTLDRSSWSYNYDRHYNRTEKNGVISNYNHLDELISSEILYDASGNLCQNNEVQFTFDALNRLVQADSADIHLIFGYDALNRCISKTSDGSTEFYLYEGEEELGSFKSDGTSKELKIPGLYRKPIVLELQGQLFALILDYRGNIRRLVDINKVNMTQSLDYSAFGEELSTIEFPFNPWRYSAKRYDRDIGLYYFGHRFYDPQSARWVSMDPAGFIDGTNVYAYVLNNPLSYHDRNGLSLGGFLLGLGEIALGAGVMVTGGALELVTLGGYTFGFVFQEAAGLGMIAHGLSLASLHSRDLSLRSTSTAKPITFDGNCSFTKSSFLNPANVWSEVYAPDRPLPLTGNGIPIPETDAPHTELGTREGTKGNYPQAREFDENGKPVRDIDFTDHGYPKNHPNPHQHRPKPNPTGGTPQRGPPEPVPGWSY